MNLARFYCIFICYICGIQFVNGQYRLAPKNTIGVEGQTAVMQCAINGITGVVVWNHIVTGKPTLQLSIGGHIDVTLGKHSRIAVIGNRGRGEYHLRIKNVRMSDAGRYECMALVGLTRIVKRSAALRVVRAPSQGFPVCLMEPAFGLAPGMEVVLSCETMGGVPTAKVRWHNGKKSLTPNTEGQVSYTHTLTAADYGQTYICQEITPAYKTPRTCEVTPLEIDLRVDLQPSPRAEVRPGGTVTFTCYGQGTNRFSYKWELNDQALPFDKNVIVHGPNGHKLTIKGITAASNNAKVSCVLRNNHGLTVRTSSVISVMTYNNNKPGNKPIPTMPFLQPGTELPFGGFPDSDLGRPIRPVRPTLSGPVTDDYKVHFESELAEDWGMDPPYDSAGVSPSTMTAIAAVLVGILIGIFIAVGVVLGKKYFKNQNGHNSFTSASYNRTHSTSIPASSLTAQRYRKGPSEYDLPPRDYPTNSGNDDDPESRSYLGLRPESLTSTTSQYLGLHSHRPRLSTYHPDSYYSDEYEVDGSNLEYYEDILNQDTRESVYHYRFSPPVDASEIHPRCMSADRSTRHFLPR